MIYGRDHNGDVVARKLIAVTSAAGVIGYRTYAFAGHDEHRAALDEISRTFARRSD